MRSNQIRLTAVEYSMDREGKKVVAKKYMQDALAKLEGADRMLRLEVWESAAMRKELREEIDMVINYLQGIKRQTR